MQLKPREQCDVCLAVHDVGCVVTDSWMGLIVKGSSSYDWHANQQKPIRSWSNVCNTCRRTIIEAVDKAVSDICCKETNNALTNTSTV